MEGLTSQKFPENVLIFPEYIKDQSHFTTALERMHFIATLLLVKSDSGADDVSSKRIAAVQTLLTQIKCFEEHHQVRGKLILVSLFN
jgi:hypothetical protein